MYLERAHPAFLTTLVVLVLGGGVSEDFNFLFIFKSIVQILISIQTHHLKKVLAQLNLYNRVHKKRNSLENFSFSKWGLDRKAENSTFLSLP